MLQVPRVGPLRLLEPRKIPQPNASFDDLEEKYLPSYELPKQLIGMQRIGSSPAWGTLSATLKSFPYPVYSELRGNQQKGERMKIKIEPDGTTTHIYTEKFDLGGMGKKVIMRASQVEPNENNEWEADMALSGGPVLGPFPTRKEALAAEVKWLEKNVL